jgi:hypothetical protein
MEINKQEDTQKKEEKIWTSARLNAFEKKNWLFV